MARIRTVKPAFFSCPDLAGCSPHARLLAVGLLQLADRDGRLLALAVQIHAHAFPYEPLVQVEALLDELEAIEYVARYTVQGRAYLWIPKFREHQRISGKELYLSSAYPPHPSDTKQRKKASAGLNVIEKVKCVSQVLERQEKTALIIPGEALGEAPGEALEEEEEEEKERNVDFSDIGNDPCHYYKTSGGTVLQHGALNQFLEFWHAWNWTANSKAETAQAWIEIPNNDPFYGLQVEGLHDEIVAAASLAAAARAAQLEGGDKPKHAPGWLRESRWESDPTDPGTRSPERTESTLSADQGLEAAEARIDAIHARALHAGILAPYPGGSIEAYERAVELEISAAGVVT